MSKRYEEERGNVFNASTARNNSAENKFKQFVLSRTFASGFGLDLMIKDLTTALDLAHATGTPAPFSAACRELWATAQTQLGSGADHTAVVQWFEALARTTLGSDCLDHAVPAVNTVYDGPEGDLWELIMGQQIHIGGFQVVDGSRRAQLTTDRSPR